MPATPATSATTIVSLFTVVRLPSTPVSCRSKSEGIRSSRSSVNVQTAAVQLATPRPTASVARARPASAARRLTTPTAIAAIGRRSGLTAIAPTMRITFPSSTPYAAITPATLMNATYRAMGRE
jgi:hypothetical protein